MSRNYGYVISLVLIILFVVPSISHAKIFTDNVGVNVGLSRVNNSGYGDVYGAMNLTFGAFYEKYFASLRRLGVEAGFRLNYDSGSTTGSGTGTTFVSFPIYAGLKYRFLSEKRWYPYLGAGIQQLFYSESVDRDSFEDESGNSIGYYFQGGFQRKWGRSRATVYEMRFSSNSLDTTAAGAGGKSPDAGSLEFIFGIVFGLR